MKFYTGIGSRRTPEDVQDFMSCLASMLNVSYGYTLRSGHAIGADWAFEQGAKDNAHIYLPWKGFGTKPYKDDPGRPILGTPIVADSFELTTHTELYDEVCRRLNRENSYFSRAVRMLTYRDMHQVIGHEERIVKSDFVVCWTDAPGGTHYAIEAANIHGIPVYNIFEHGINKTMKLLKFKLDEEEIYYAN